MFARHVGVGEQAKAELVSSIADAQGEPMWLSSFTRWLAPLCAFWIVRRYEPTSLSEQRLTRGLGDPALIVALRSVTVKP
jgi:hypothetical protein